MARKTYLCGHCRSQTIKKGEEYVESTITPDHGDVGNQGWQRGRSCADCAELYGYWPEVGPESEPGVPSEREYA